MIECGDCEEYDNGFCWDGEQRVDAYDCCQWHTVEKIVQCEACEYWDYKCTLC